MDMIYLYLMYLITFLVGFIIFQIAYKILKEPKYFPKGPRSFFPLIGGMLNIGTKPHLYFFKLQKKWGGIFAFDLGPKRIVVLNNFKIINDALSRLEFQGRNQEEVVKLRQANGGPNGILCNTANKVWAEHRRFTLRTLRDFGFGKSSSIQNLVEFEAKKLVENFRKLNGSPITIIHDFNGPVLSSLWSIVAGKKIQQNDTKMIKFFRNLDDDAKAIPPLLFYPWLFKFSKILPFVRKYIASTKFAFEFMKNEIESHKEKHIEGSEIDLIDIYLTKIKNSSPNSSFYGVEGELNLQTILYDLFSAGDETNSTALNWAVHLLAIHPEIQERVYQEIQSICQNRSINLADKQLMPYTEAFILELLRFGSIGSMISHDIMDDVKNFHGYDIPKGTMVLANLYAALNDPEYWEHPEIFQPDRFLSPDGRKILKNEAFIPFSTGRRRCLGESLARDSLFLFITSLVQNFKIYPDPNMKTIPQTIEYTTGATLVPKSFPLVFQNRINNPPN